jgi:hypothetical protein
MEVDIHSALLVSTLTAAELGRYIPVEKRSAPFAKMVDILSRHMFNNR